MICDFLIIGGDGDLAFRKLYPALYHLDHDQCLPDCLKIISVSRTKHTTRAFAEKTRQLLSEQLGDKKSDAATWKRFSKRLTHYTLDASNEAQLSVLARQVFSDPSRDLVTYLATPPGKAVLLSITA